MRGRLFAAALIVNALLSLTALGWLAWITAEPSYWFPDAFAEKGERGDRGPTGKRGPRGAVGPRGPAGPTVEEALEEVNSRISNLETDLVSLEAGISTSELQNQIDEIESSVQDVSDKMENLCSELLVSSIEPLNDLYYSAC